MSTSPLPPDPYDALGVGKDCDNDAIRKAHRKLALKHHPDRIKDPALVEQGKNEFQKIQQAYEILIDPSRRQRYDDEVKLAQLRRERMMSEPPRPTFTRTTYTARTTPAPTQPVQRDFRPDPRYAAYEERVPDSPFVESASRGFDEPLTRNYSTRKVDPRVEPNDRRASTGKTAPKDKARATAWQKPMQGISMRMAFGVPPKSPSQPTKAKAKDVKDVRDVKDKEKEKEQYQKKAKAQDVEKKRAREQKSNQTQPRQSYVDSASESESSDSESENVMPGRNTMRQPSPQPKGRRNLTPEPQHGKRQPSPRPGARSSRQQSPRIIPGSARVASPQPDLKTSRQASPRPDSRYAYDDDSHEEERKYEKIFHNAKTYQQSAVQKEARPTRPVPIRQGSDIRDSYWQGQGQAQADLARDRKSGSDSDKQYPPSARNPSRKNTQEDKNLRPPLPTHTSAPAGVRAAAASVIDRDSITPPRSRKNSHVSSNHRSQMPKFERSGSDPIPQKSASKRDSAPLRGSTLKSEVNPDSGYVTSNGSGPQTPENLAESPPRESRSRAVPTTYRVDKNEDAPRARKMNVEEPLQEKSQFLYPPEHHHYSSHQHRSESRERRGSSRSRSRDRDADGLHRSSSSRRGHPEMRPSASRNDSSSRYDDREKPRRSRMEKSPERSYFMQWDAPVKQSRSKAATYQSATTQPKISKYYEDPRAASFTRSSHQQRRPSVY